MSDEDLMRKWEKITDLKEAVREFLKHKEFLGYDFYYKDLREALLNMLERCSK